MGGTAAGAAGARQRNERVDAETDASADASPDRRPRVVGVLGGVASGKSLVTRQLQSLGAKALDADRIGHEVLREPAVRQAIVDRWGTEICDAQGEVSRPALAKRVFAAPPDGPAALAELERLTHPRIGRRLQDLLETASRAAEPPVVVLDAPVLLKAGWDAFCDVIVFVDAPAAQRRARAAARGWTAEQWAAREAAQEPLDYKQARADLTIDNSGAPEQTFEQVRRLWATVA